MVSTRSHQRGSVPSHSVHVESDEFSFWKKKSMLQRNAKTKPSSTKHRGLPLSHNRATLRRQVWLGQQGTKMYKICWVWADEIKSEISCCIFLWSNSSLLCQQRASSLLLYGDVVGSLKPRLLNVVAFTRFSRVTYSINLLYIGLMDIFFCSWMPCFVVFVSIVSPSLGMCRRWTAPRTMDANQPHIVHIQRASLTLAVFYTKLNSSQMHWFDSSRRRKKVEWKERCCMLCRRWWCVLWFLKGTSMGKGLLTLTRFRALNRIFVPWQQVMVTQFSVDEGMDECTAHHHVEWNPKYREINTHLGLIIWRARNKAPRRIQTAPTAR